MKTCKVLYGYGERCDNPVEGRTDYCATHNSMMRKAAIKASKEAEKLDRKLLKQKEASKQPRKKPKPQSEKQKDKNKAYSERVKVWKIENPQCKAMVSPDCDGVTRDCHHQKKRGELLMVEKYWIPVCGYCHDWIGRNSDEARKRGLTINHLEPEFIEPHNI